jgi:hypothetical protein
MANFRVLFNCSVRSISNTSLFNLYLDVRNLGFHTIFRLFHFWFYTDLCLYLWWFSQYSFLFKISFLIAIWFTTIFFIKWIESFAWFEWNIIKTRRLCLNNKPTLSDFWFLLFVSPRSLYFILGWFCKFNNFWLIWRSFEDIFDALRFDVHVKWAILFTLFHPSTFVMIAISPEYLNPSASSR